jgi:protein-S-isoprenylcysteine O-methyltransferase Ste14
VGDWPGALSRLLLIIAILALVLGPIWLILPTVYGLYFSFSARREEARMLREFPDEYPAYKQRTRFLIPFVL